MSAARKELMEWLDKIPTIGVEYAPAHSAPFISKYVVLPGLEVFLDEIEAERDLWWAERYATAFSSAGKGMRAARELSAKTNEVMDKTHAKR